MQFHSFVLGVIALCAFSVRLDADPKSLEQHWREAGLKFETFEANYATEECYQTERNFLACVFALDAAVALEKSTLVPADRLTTDAAYGPERSDFGWVKVVGAKERSTESIAELLKNLREERKRGEREWRELFAASSTSKIRFEEIVGWIKQTESFKKDESVLTADALNSYLRILYDPHTVILPASYERSQMAGNGESLTGIGAIMKSVRKDGVELVVIQSPLEGSPALAAGVRAKDIITEVDGVSVQGMSLPDVGEKIRGPEGTEVELTLDRAGQAVSVTVRRQRIEIPNVVSKTIPNGSQPLGYLKISSFMKKDSTCQEASLAVVSLESQKVQGLILDLRDNPGGLMSEAICVANLFTERGQVIVTKKDLLGLDNEVPFYAERETLTRLPMVTLINSTSASASEIVAGALQDHARSFLVGERTYGKATVQAPFDLDGGLLVLRRTIARFYLPSGRTNQVEGIHPDITVYNNPNPTEDDTVAFREEDESMALEAQGPGWTQPRPEVISKLEQCIRKNGTARFRFEDQEKDSALSADYPLLYAQDALNCSLEDAPQTTTFGFEIGHGGPRRW